MPVVGVAEVLVRPSFSGTQQAVGKQMDGIAATTGTRAGRTMGSRLGGALVSTAKFGAAAAGAGLATALVKGFGRLQALENAQAKLTGLGHSAKTVEGIMKNANASVKGTAFGLGEAGATAAGAVAAGVKPGKELERTLKLTADAATIAGTDMGSMGAIFNKVASSNKIQGDVIAQLNDQGIPIVQLLGEELGTTAEETLKLASEGKVNFETFQAAMQSGLGGAAQESGKTLTGAFKNTMASVGRIGAGLLEGLYPMATKFFQNAIKWLAPLEDSAKVAGEKIAGFLQTAIAGAQGLYDVLVKGDFTTRFRNAFGLEEDHPFTGFLFTVRDVFKGIGDAVSKIDFSSWNGFTDSLGSAGGSLGGSFASIGESVKTLMPALDKFREHLPEIGGAVAKVAAFGIEVLAGALSFLADHVDTIIKWMPAIVAGFIAWRVAQAALTKGTLTMQAAQLAMTPVMTLNNILRITAIRMEQAQTRAVAANTAAQTANNTVQKTSLATKAKNVVATAAQRVAAIASTVATWAQTAAQKALNAAMKANPIMIIVGLIALLVGAVIWLYKNNETARKVIDAVWAGIKKAVQVAWDWIKGAFDAAKTWLTKTLPDAFNKLRDVATLAWKLIKSRILGAIEDVRAWVDDKVTKIKIVWNAVWNAARETVTRVFGRIKSTIKSVWENGIKPIFDIIGKVLKGDFVGAFESAKDHIGKIWKKLRGLAAKPINFIIDTVYNKGLKRALDKVRSVVGGKELPNATKIPEYARGGFHQGGWAVVGEEGPELVNFSNPGRIYTADQTRSMLDGDQQMPMGALTDGSESLQAEKGIGGWFSNITEGAKKAFSAATNWARGALAAAAGLILNPIKNGLGALLPKNGLGNTAKSAVNGSIDKALDWIRGHDDQAAANGTAVYDGAMGAFHRPSAGPFTSMFGAPRGKYPHAGVDIAGGGRTVAALNGIVQRAGWNVLPGRSGIGLVLNHGPGFWTYYGHNPVNGLQVGVGDQVKAGQHIGYQGATGNVTGTHLHFETHTGKLGNAVNPMAYLHDQGGVLNPGLSAILNNTGKPEAILNARQWADMHALAESVRSREGQTLVGELTLDSGEFIGKVRGVVRSETGKIFDPRRARQMTGG